MTKELRVNKVLQVQVHKERKVIQVLQVLKVNKEIQVLVVKEHKVNKEILVQGEAQVIKVIKVPKELQDPLGVVVEELPLVTQVLVVHH